MINLLKSRRRYTQEKQWGMFRDGKCKPAIVAEKRKEPWSYNVKKEKGICTGEIENT